MNMSTPAPKLRYDLISSCLGELAKEWTRLLLLQGNTVMRAASLDTKGIPVPGKHLYSLMGTVSDQGFLRRGRPPQRAR